MAYLVQSVQLRGFKAVYDYGGFLSSQHHEQTLTELWKLDSENRTFRWVLAWLLHIPWLMDVMSWVTEASHQVLNGNHLYFRDPTDQQFEKKHSPFLALGFLFDSLPCVNETQVFFPWMGYGETTCKWLSLPVLLGNNCYIRLLFLWVIPHNSDFPVWDMVVSLGRFTVRG